MDLNELIVKSIESLYEKDSGYKEILGDDVYRSVLADVIESEIKGFIEKNIEMFTQFAMLQIDVSDGDDDEDDDDYDESVNSDTDYSLDDDMFNEDDDSDILEQLKEFEQM